MSYELFSSDIEDLLLTLQVIACPGLLCVQVGRPRPDFMARCWPDGAAVKWNSDGTPACGSGAIRPDEGRKSFPSGARSLDRKFTTMLAVLFGHGKDEGRPRSLQSACPLRDLRVSALKPAGHTSWSTTGLGFLSLWLAGKLQVFDRRGGQPWRLVATLLPISGAVYIGLTRIEVGPPCRPVFQSAMHSLTSGVAQYPLSL